MYAISYKQAALMNKTAFENAFCLCYDHETKVYDRNWLRFFVEGNQLICCYYKYDQDWVYVWDHNQGWLRRK